MGDKIAAFVAGIIGLAIIAVLVSTRANTSNVITSAASGLSAIIGAAVSPITGTTANNSTSTGNVLGSLLGGTSSNILGTNTISGLAGGGLGSFGLGSSSSTSPFDLGGISSLANIGSIAALA